MTSATYKLRRFVHTHDDIPAFHATFLVSTFLAAALFHAGFFALLIVLHMCLDYVKYRDYHGFTLGVTFKAIILESIHDIGLLLLSLTFAVYLHHTFFLVAVSGLLRSEMTVIRALGIVLPRIRIVEHMLAILLDLNSYFIAPCPGLERSLTRMEKYSLYTTVICGSLLAFSFLLYQGHPHDLLAIYATEFGFLR